MTKKEMEKRIEELGGLNSKTALIVSIEKWKGLSGCWQERESFPWRVNCALCGLYVGCSGCPLNSCGTGSEYVIARRAINEEDRSDFMEARRNLIRRMQRALKKLEAGE